MQELGSFVAGACMQLRTPAVTCQKSCKPAELMSWLL